MPRHAQVRAFLLRRDNHEDNHRISRHCISEYCPYSPRVRPYSPRVRKRLVLCKEKTLRDEIRATVIIGTRANCRAKKKWAKKFQKMLKLSPKDKAPKTWKFRHLPLCAKGATVNHCDWDLLCRLLRESIEHGISSRRMSFVNCTHPTRGRTTLSDELGRWCTGRQSPTTFATCVAAVQRVWNAFRPMPPSLFSSTPAIPPLRADRSRFISARWKAVSRQHRSIHRLAYRRYLRPYGYVSAGHEPCERVDGGQGHPAADYGQRPTVYFAGVQAVLLRLGNQPHGQQFPPPPSQLRCRGCS